jgi:hypothetical protein
MKKTHLVQILFFVQIFISATSFANPIRIGINCDKTQNQDFAQS